MVNRKLKNYVLKIQNRNNARFVRFPLIPMHFQTLYLNCGSKIEFHAWIVCVDFNREDSCDWQTIRTRISWWASSLQLTWVIEKTDKIFQECFHVFDLPWLFCAHCLTWIFLQPNPAALCDICLLLDENKIDMSFIIPDHRPLTNPNKKYCFCISFI